MIHTKVVAALVIAGIAGSAAAQDTITYCWAVGDTGDNDGVIESPESALLTLWATVAPDQGASEGGFAGTLFDIRGLSNWETGTVEWYFPARPFHGFDGSGTLQANNDITGAEVFRMPLAFNPGFDFSNPIPIYEIRWTPDDYTARTVRIVDANHEGDWVYIDAIGNGAAFDIAGCGPCGVSLCTFEVAGDAAPDGGKLDGKLFWVLDWNGDGVSDLLDVSDFLKAWSVDDPRADLQGDQAVDVRDAVVFVAVWAAGS